MKVEVNMNVDDMVQEITQRVIKEIKPIVKNDSDDTIFDVEGLSVYLKVKTGWIYQQTHVNAIPFVKVGNLLRFRKSEIDKWLNSNKAGAL